jgi:hypothetical protein
LRFFRGAPPRETTFFGDAAPEPPLKELFFKKSSLRNPQKNCKAARADTICPYILGIKISGAPGCRAPHNRNNIVTDKQKSDTGLNPGFFYAIIIKINHKARQEDICRN